VVVELIMRPNLGSAAYQALITLDMAPHRQENARV
jgi:hypothetical protein